MILWRGPTTLCIFVIVYFKFGGERGGPVATMFTIDIGNKEQRGLFVVYGLLAVVYEVHGAMLFLRLKANRSYNFNQAGRSIISIIDNPGRHKTGDRRSTVGPLISLAERKLGVANARVP
jgi:hypothetical protein